MEKNGRLQGAKATAATGKGKRGSNIFTYLYRLRLKVTKGDVTVANLSALFILFTAIFAVWVLIVGLVAAVLLGYKVRVERNSRDFAGENFDSMVKNASSNVKNTVFTIAKDIGIVGNPASEGGSHSGASSEQEAPRAESAASGTTPVNVQFPDGGSVEVKDDAEGFHQADIQ